MDDVPLDQVLRLLNPPRRCRGLGDVPARAPASCVAPCSAFTTRASVVPGPRRDLARLRLRTQRLGTDARGAVDAVVTGGGIVGDLPTLVSRIERLAVALDARLRVWESQPDDEALATLLASAQAEIARLEHVIGRIREVAAAGLLRLTDDAAALLVADVDRELSALQEGVRVLQALTDDMPAMAGPANDA